MCDGIRLDIVVFATKLCQPNSPANTISTNTGAERASFYHTKVSQWKNASGLFSAPFYQGNDDNSQSRIQIQIQSTNTSDRNLLQHNGAHANIL